MKKFLSSFLAILLVLSLFNISTLAAETEGLSGNIKLGDLEKLEESGEVEIEYLTYNQMITEIAENQGISKARAESLYPDQTTKPSTYKSGITTLSGCSGCGTAPVRVTQKLSVSSKYTPYVQIYVWVYSSGSFRQFKKLVNVGLDRKDSDSVTVKQFSGDLQAEITSGNSIWYLVNGDFYNNGTTTITGEATANGLLWSGGGSISYASNFYAYYNKAGTIFLNR